MHGNVHLKTNIHKNKIKKYTLKDNTINTTTYLHNTSLPTYLHTFIFTHLHIPTIHLYIYLQLKKW